MIGELHNICMLVKFAESKADTQQHLHKRSAVAVVGGQTPMGANFFCINIKHGDFVNKGITWPLSSSFHPNLKIILNLKFFLFFSLFFLFI